MSRNWARFLAGLVTIAIVWVAAYWWLNPRDSGKISFGGAPAGASGAPVSKAPPPQPRSTPQVVDLKRPPLVSNKDRVAVPPSPKAAPGPSSPPPVAPPAVTLPDQKAPETTKPAVIPPRFDDYTVRVGDSLSSIASARLGSVRHIDAIRRSNPLKDLDKLKPGDVIRIPQDPENIQGKAVQGAPTPVAPQERQGELLEYTVKSGDTLSRIAKEKYGNTSYQDLIYQANRDRLSSPNSLKEGQKLRLPRKPAT